MVYVIGVIMIFSSMYMLGPMITFSTLMLLFLKHLPLVLAPFPKKVVALQLSDCFLLSLVYLA
jgi:hypothetical protein